MTRSDTRDNLLYLKPWPLASYSFPGQTLTWGVWPVRLYIDVIWHGTINPVNHLPMWLHKHHRYNEVFTNFITCKLYSQLWQGIPVMSLGGKERWERMYVAVLDRNLELGTAWERGHCTWQKIGLAEAWDHPQVFPAPVFDCLHKTGAGEAWGSCQTVSKTLKRFEDFRELFAVSLFEKFVLLSLAQI